MANSARVLRPGGSTLSLLTVQASIWPIRRSRIATASFPSPVTLTCIGAEDFIIS